MATRIMSAAVALVVAFFVLYYSDTIILYLAISVISAVLVYELLHAQKLLKFKLMGYTSIIFAFLLPFCLKTELNKYISLLLAIYTVVIFIYFLTDNQKINFTDLSVMLCSTILPSVSISNLLFVYNKSKDYGLYYLCLILATAWIADAGAYFVGTWFGKHKLCPRISPKKTVEGAVGGIIVNCLLIIFATYIYQLYLRSTGKVVTINYMVLFTYVIIASLFSIVGDLVASMVKRQCDIKDYGKIMPGHGGLLDRFDSVLFVAPFTSILLSFVKLIK